MFGARVIGQAAGLAVTVLAARELGPTAFGLYSFVVVGAVLLADLPGAGIDLSAVRVSARHWTRDPDRARGVLLASGAVKIAVAAALCGVTALAAETVARPLGHAALTDAARFAAVSAVGLALLEYGVAVLQARERFRAVFALSSASAVLKFAPVALLALAGALTLATASLAFAASAYASAVIALALARRAWGGRAAWRGGVLRELFDYSRWFVPATMLVALLNGLDVLAVTTLAGPTAAGVYSSARMLAIPLGLAGIAVGTVLLPRLGRLAAEEDVAPHVRAVQLRVIVLGALVATALVALAPVLLPVVYGGAYADAVLVFQILALAYTVEVTAWPALVALMVADRPDLVAKVCLAVLLASATGYAIAVPPFGPVGAAVVFAGGRALLFASYALLYGRGASAARRAPVGGTP